VCMIGSGAVLLASLLFPSAAIAYESAPATTVVVPVEIASAPATLTVVLTPEAYGDLAAAISGALTASEASAAASATGTADVRIVALRGLSDAQAGLLGVLLGGVIGFVAFSGLSRVWGMR
jgi:hypothetical protein